MSAVSVSLEELKKGIPHETLNEAFGPQSLGILIVKDLPESFHQLRRSVLESAQALAKLPKEELEKLENEESTWLVGWSCGKEMLEAGKPDIYKGSWYVNTAFHNDPKADGPDPEKLGGAEFAARYPTYTTPNVWPSPSLPGLENFQSQLKQLINMIVDTAEVVAQNCDRYCDATLKDYKPGFLERVVKTSSCSKARLLHYFPMKEGDNADDWCTQHLDHSCLTGLTSALFIDESTNTVLNSCPDKEAGLYIRDRQNQVVKVAIPSDCLAFQTGSTLHEVSRGQFKAVPHFVRGTDHPNIARNTLAVFCQPDLNEMVNDSENFAQYAERVIKGFH
ncbi:hypothetical protein DICA4_D22298 [Diutina catenulata]